MCDTKSDAKQRHAPGGEFAVGFFEISDGSACHPEYSYQEDVVDETGSVGELSAP